MSITYQIYFEKSLDIEAFLVRLQKCLNLGLSLEPQQNIVAIVGIPDLELAFYPVRTPQDLFIQEDYGFLPGDCLNIRLNKFNLTQAQDQFQDLLCACLQDSRESILALREHESVVLHLKNEALELNHAEPLWHSQSRKVRFQAFLKKSIQRPVI